MLAWSIRVSSCSTRGDQPPRCIVAETVKSTSAQVAKTRRADLRGTRRREQRPAARHRPARAEPCRRAASRASGGGPPRPSRRCARSSEWAAVGRDGHQGEIPRFGPCRSVPGLRSRPVRLVEASRDQVGHALVSRWSRSRGPAEASRDPVGPRLVEEPRPWPRRLETRSAPSVGRGAEALAEAPRDPSEGREPLGWSRSRGPAEAPETSALGWSRSRGPGRGISRPPATPLSHPGGSPVGRGAEALAEASRDHPYSPPAPGRKLLENGSPHSGSRAGSGAVSVGGAWESFLMQATGSAPDSVVATLEEVSRLHARPDRGGRRRCSSWRRCSPTSTAVTACPPRCRGRGGCCRAWSGRSGSAGPGPRRSRSSPAPSSVPGCRSAPGRRGGWSPTPSTSGTGSPGPGPGWSPDRPGSRTPAGSPPPPGTSSSRPPRVVDAAMVDHLDGSLPWGRFEHPPRRPGRRRRPRPRRRAGGRRGHRPVRQADPRPASTAPPGSTSAPPSGSSPASRPPSLPRRRPRRLRGHATPTTNAASRPSPSSPTPSAPSSSSPPSPPTAATPTSTCPTNRCPTPHGPAEINMTTTRSSRPAGSGRSMRWGGWTRSPAGSGSPPGGYRTGSPHRRPGHRRSHRDPPHRRARSAGVETGVPVRLGQAPPAADAVPAPVRRDPGRRQRWRGPLRGRGTPHPRLRPRPPPPAARLRHQTRPRPHRPGTRRRLRAPRPAPRSRPPDSPPPTRSPTPPTPAATSTSTTPRTTTRPTPPAPRKHWSTRLTNLGPLNRTHHRIKTHGKWTLRQPFQGIYLWRDPHGQIYLVDHTGTHPVPAARTFDPDLDLYPTDNLIHIDFPQHG